MSTQSHVDQVLKQLNLPFYNELLEERGSLIWKHDGAPYDTSKFTTKFCREVGLFMHKKALVIARP